MSEALLKIDDLHVSFATYAGKVQAVRGVGLSLEQGGNCAVVGESGCGKKRYRSDYHPSEPLPTLQY